MKQGSCSTLTQWLELLLPHANEATPQILFSAVAQDEISLHGTESEPLGGGISNFQQG